jgi:hypothetical protein
MTAVDLRRPRYSDSVFKQPDTPSHSRGTMRPSFASSLSLRR